MSKDDEVSSVSEVWKTVKRNREEREKIVEKVGERVEGKRKGKEQEQVERASANYEKR